MLKSNASMQEGAFLSLYQFPRFLNPTWRVIYQEAVRGNHLIFKNFLAADRIQRLTLDRISWHQNHCDEVEQCFAAMLLSSDMKEIIRLAKSISAKNQTLLYDIYQRTIQNWSWDLKNSLN